MQGFLLQLWGFHRATPWAICVGGVCLTFSVAVGSADPAPGPKILQQTVRLYSSLRSLEVFTRTERSVVSGPAVVDVRRPKGIAVHELGLRIIRNQAFRWQYSTDYGVRGCTSYLPDQVLALGADGQLVRTPPVRPIQPVKFSDNKVYITYIRDWFGTANLPLKLFAAPRARPVLPVEKADMIRIETMAGRPCYVIRVRVDCTVLQIVPNGRKFQGATWTVWIDQETAMLHRVDAHEEWLVGSQEASLLFREYYRNQVFNLAFPPGAFEPEVPPPVSPAAEMPAAPPPGDGGRGGWRSP